MAGRIPKRHPLVRLFAMLTETNFARHLGWPDVEVIGYLTNVLTDFVHVDQLYKVRNAQGRRVEEVAEMLAEGDLLHRADTVDREREVHRHIGDYTLFMAGIFPEFLRRLRTSKILISPDALLDYVQVGKRSYRIVSEPQSENLEPPRRQERQWRWAAERGPRGKADAPLGAVRSFGSEGRTWESWRPGYPAPGLGDLGG